MKRTTYPFAFIEFKHEESVPYALALLSGIKLFNTPLNIRPRDGTEMEKKLKEAERVARNMHPQEQAAALQNLRQHPNPQQWYIAQNTDFNQQQAIYTQLAIAQMHNAMLSSPFPQYQSPPPFFASTPQTFLDPLIPFTPHMMWQNSFGDFHGAQRQSRERYRENPYSREENRSNVHRSNSDYYDDRSRSRSNNRDRDGDRDRNDHREHRSSNRR